MEKTVHTLIWMQAGACSGDSMSLLCAEDPSFPEFLEAHHVELLWHPSLSSKPMRQFADEIQQILDGQLELNILCVEGSLITGPNDTGMFDSFLGSAKIDVIEKLCQAADYVVAVGTCASFGGVHAAPPNPTDCTGLQFDKDQKGALLPPDWVSKGGLPVINISGCPTHPATVLRTLSLLLAGAPVEFNEWNMPAEFFSSVVHQGCTRNEYHEYHVEEKQFGHNGCLFFNLGCQGPTTLATCNNVLWNGQNSKTRAGVPCFGCTMPDFPRNDPLFRTKTIADIPVVLPLGVSRPHYMSYKGLAHDAAPERVMKRKMKV